MAAGVRRRWKKGTKVFVWDEVVASGSEAADGERTWDVFPGFVRGRVKPKAGTAGTQARYDISFDTDGDFAYDLDRIFGDEDAALADLERDLDNGTDDTSG